MWPTATEEPFASYINNTPKYVVSTTLNKVEWANRDNAMLLKGNLAEAITKLKQQHGKNIAVEGSPSLVRSLLFLHGNPDTADIWDGVVGQMQQQHRCIAPDLPGFGRSAAPRDFDYSFENLGHFLDELVEGVGAALPLNVVTHDFDGAFGMAWAV